MVRVNSHGYLERILPKGKRRSDSIGRNWWLVKRKTPIHLGQFAMPQEYWGKRVRFLVEVIEEKKPPLL